MDTTVTVEGLPRTDANGDIGDAYSGVVRIIAQDAADRFTIEFAGTGEIANVFAPLVRTRALCSLSALAPCPSRRS